MMMMTTGATIVGSMEFTVTAVVVLMIAVAALWLLFWSATVEVRDGAHEAYKVYTLCDVKSRSPQHQVPKAL